MLARGLPARESETPYRAVFRAVYAIEFLTHAIQSPIAFSTSLLTTDVMASDTTNSRLRTTIRESLLAGVGLTIPLIITLAVLAFVLNFISQAHTPIVDGLNLFWPSQLPTIVIEAITLVTLFVLVFLIGFIAEHTSGDWLANGFHAGIERIPAVGSAMRSIRRTVA